MMQCVINYELNLCLHVAGLQDHATSPGFRVALFFNLLHSILTYRSCSIHYIYVVSRDSIDVIHKLGPCSIDTYLLQLLSARLVNLPTTLMC